MGSPLLLDRDFLQTLEQLSLLCRQNLSGAIGTGHRSRNRGPGLEFADYRRYSFGDDPRFLDWNAYLRLGKLFLKIYQTEEHVPVRVLLDTSRSMDCDGAGESKFVYAQRLAAAFCYLALLRLDAAAVVPFGERISKPLVVSGGRDRFWPLLEYMSGLACAGRTNLLMAAKQFLENFPTRGVAVVLSDFFDDGGYERAVEMLRSSGHDFVLVQVHTAEEQRPAEHGELDLEDAESGVRQRVHSSPAAARAYERAFLEFADELQRLAVRNGGRYARAVTSVPYQQFILGALRQGRVLE
jgi:uncharacterized protein (DUF58 family)